MLDLNYGELMILNRLLNDRMQKCIANYKESNDVYWHDQNNKAWDLIVKLEKYSDNKPCHCGQTEKHNVTNECIPF